MFHHNYGYNHKYNLKIEQKNDRKFNLMGTAKDT